jgi:uncharacterized membrane protein YfcA
MLSPTDFLLIAAAAVVAGFVNALAGGGTLLTFPVLMAAGLPAVVANVTNTVALCPGYVGGIAAQRQDLRGQSSRLWLLIPAGVAGGLTGGFLLLQSGERLFRLLVPYLILGASALLAIQDPVRRWLQRQASAGRTGRHTHVVIACGGVALAAIYGGYFGAGLSVIVLAVLGLVLDDTLTRLNALKQAIGLAVNLAAALFFVFSAHIVWPAALVMAVGALAGGTLGGRLAARIRPATLRAIVVGVGTVVGVIYLVR